MKIRPYLATEKTLNTLVGHADMTNQLLFEIGEMLAGTKQPSISPEETLHQHGAWAKSRVFTTELTEWERE